MLLDHDSSAKTVLMYFSFQTVPISIIHPDKNRILLMNKYLFLFSLINVSCVYFDYSKENCAVNFTLSEKIAAKVMSCGDNALVPWLELGSLSMNVRFDSISINRFTGNVFISGRVSDEKQDEPIKNAKIMIHSNTSDDHLATPYTHVVCTTDSIGGFTFNSKLDSSDQLVVCAFSFTAKVYAPNY